MQKIQSKLKPKLLPLAAVLLLLAQHTGAAYTRQVLTTRLPLNCLGIAVPRRLMQTQRKICAED